MSFELENIPGADFHLLNEYFAGNFEKSELIEHSEITSLHFVDIHSREWYFNGIRIGHSDWLFKKPIELKWRYSLKTEMVTCMAGLHGVRLIAHDNGQSTEMIRSQQHNLYYSPGNEIGNGVLKSSSNRAGLFFIQFPRDVFLEITSQSTETLKRFNDHIVKGTPAALSSPNLPMDMLMQNMITNILHCRYKDGIKKMYLISKAIEFLVLQAETSESQVNPVSTYLKSAYDKECIQFAREYVSGRLEAPPTLPELSKIAGVNEYKLKRGFKEMFGTTVFGYVAEARLEIAKNYLLNTNKSITEIADETGYSSVQHFSNAFKKKFNYSPRTLKHGLK